MIAGFAFCGIIEKQGVSFMDYENMGIYDLRNYARHIGVKSPTTLKRDELIQKINEIIEGNAPKEALTKKGRPPKHKADSNFMLDMIIPDNLFNNTNSDDYKSFAIDINKDELSRFQSKFCESGNSAKTDNLVFSGYFDKYSNDFGIAYFKGYMTTYNKENTIITLDLIEKYALKRGDYVVGGAKFIPSKNIMLANDIETINGISVKQLKNRQDFDKIIPMFPKNVINFEKCNDINLKIAQKYCPIAEGSRVYIEKPQAEEYHTFAEDFLECLTNQKNLNTILVSIDDSPENIYHIMAKFSNLEICERRPSQTREQFFEQVEMLLLNAISKVEYGKKIAVVFYNVNNFYNALAENEIMTKKVSQSEANITATNKLKDMFNLAKNCGENSLTMIFLSGDNEFVFNANCNISLTQNPIPDTDIVLNFEKSYTNNIKEILSECDLEKYYEFKKSFSINPNLDAIEKLLS